jgi:Fe2+ transport system protein FeoA
MGIDEGCEFFMERVSPFGDPCMIRLKGSHLALRRGDFDAMELKPAEEAEA